MNWPEYRTRLSTQPSRMSSKAQMIRDLLREGSKTVKEIAAECGTSQGYVRMQRRYGDRRQESVPAANKRKRENQERFLKCLEESRGIVSDAARKARISADRAYVWMKEEPEFKEKVDLIKEISIDFVESSLFRQIQKEIPASTIFFLKTRAKHRGYVERTEHTGAEGGPLDIRVIVPRSVASETGDTSDRPAIDVESTVHEDDGDTTTESS